MGKVKTCPICGKAFECLPHGVNKVCCSPECTSIYRKAADKARRDARRAKLRPKIGPQLLTAKECRRCRTCRYRNRADGSGLITCDYILMTGEPRGCEVSETCERYERSGRA